MNRLASFAFGAVAGSMALAVAAVALEPSTAKQVRLIGDCGGRIMAAMEESDFPESGCAWIEPIRMDQEGESDQ